MVKGGFGRYHHMRLLTPDVLNFVKNSITYSIYQWRDPNRNNDYDAGEINLDPTGPDFVEQTGMEFDALPPNFVNNPDEKQPKTDEWSAVARAGADPEFCHPGHRALYQLVGHLPGQELLATLRVLQHSDHESGPGRRWPARDRGRRRPGHVL